METKDVISFRRAVGGGRSQSIDITLDYLVSQRWSVESYKNKYIW